jgi:hypothetical protein
MSPVPKEHIDQMRNVIKEVLGSNVSDIFLKRLDPILNNWAAGTITAAQACEKVQKSVGLFFDEDKAREIGYRCAPVVMKESVIPKK